MYACMCAGFSVPFIFSLYDFVHLQLNTYEIYTEKQAYSILSNEISMVKMTPFRLLMHKRIFHIQL